MGKAAVAVIALLSLAACATVPEPVQVPVAVPCPAPPAVARPHLPVSDLKQGSTPAQVMKAYALSIEKLKGYAEGLEVILKGYR